MSYFFLELYSFYEDADHYWDFNLPNNIVDNVTSQQGSFSGDVIAKRSPTGIGLRVVQGAVINPLPDFGNVCPVNPSLCSQGLTVSVFIKVTTLDSVQQPHPYDDDRPYDFGHPYDFDHPYDDDRKYKFLFGNMDKDFRHITNYYGFAVGVKGSSFEIIVNSQNYVCSSSRASITMYLWSHLAFTWKDPELPGGGLEIFVDSNKVSSALSRLNADCSRHTGDRMLLPHLKIGFNDDDLSVTAEFDHLAIWYQKLQANNSILTAPWVQAIGNV